MKIVVCEPGPDFSVKDVHLGLLRSLTALGCETVSYRLNDRFDFFARAQVEKGGKLVTAFHMEQAAWLACEGIKAMCYDVQPDVLIIISGFLVPPHIYEAVRRHGVKVVLVHTESPYEDEQQLLRARFADINLINDPTNLDRFREVAPTWYMPHAHDPDIHCPGPADENLQCDFAFVGTGFPSRIAYLEAVDWSRSGISAKLGGNWESLADDSPLRELLMFGPDSCMANAETVALYRSCKASANFYRREGRNSDGETHGIVGWSMGPREVELAAVGTFFLRDPRPEGDELLPMLPTFDGPDDFADKLKWWLAHDEAREKATGQAQAAVADRTFESNAKLLLQLIDN